MPLKIPNLAFTSTPYIHIHDLPFGAGTSGMRDGGTNPTGALFDSITGAGAPWIMSSGLLRVRGTNNNGDGIRCLSPSWPLPEDFSASGLLDSQLWYRSQYTFRCLARATPTSLGGVGIRSAQNPINQLNTSLGYSFEEDGAGQWNLYRRLTSGSGFQTLAATGLSTSVWRRIEFIFVQGQSPTLECKMDDITFYRAVGVAEMPTVANQNEVLGPALGTGIAQFTLMMQAELLIEVVQ